MQILTLILTELTIENVVLTQIIGFLDHLMRLLKTGCCSVASKTRILLPNIPY